MHFSPEHLLEALRRLPTPRQYLVAFSGGMDSQVLLHALHEVRARLPAPLEAMHVNHRLSHAADDWAAECAGQCRRLAIPFQCRVVDATPPRGGSPEAAAREARYRALADYMEAGGMLLTAHHQDDQAETLLLQLLRGAGAHGLAGMPPCAPFADGWLARPLLGFERTALRDYARRAALSWVEDESNYDTRVARNHLRHRVLPLLRDHWPGLTRVLGRSSEHFADTAALLDQLADGDLARCRGTVPGTLAVRAVRALEQARARNLLRRWLRRAERPVPAAVHIERILTEVLPAREDATPLVQWPGAEVQRYRDNLYSMAPLLPPGDPLSWDLRLPLPLPGGLGCLTAEPVTGEGLALDARARVTVHFAVHGARCRPAGRKGHHPLKKLFQEAGIPPWERQRTPLLYVEGTLAQVGEYWRCAEFAAAEGVPGVRIRWHREG